jgi:hypothetical protein
MRGHFEVFQGSQNAQRLPPNARGIDTLAVVRLSENGLSTWAIARELGVRSNNYPLAP